MLNFQFCNYLDPGLDLAFSLRSARNLAPYDFAGPGAFLAPGAAPTQPLCPMREMPYPYAGAYLGSYAGPPGVFWEPLYIVTIHDLGTAAADGTRPAPRAMFAFDAPFSRGSSTYSSPPFFTY